MQHVIAVVAFTLAVSCEAATTPPWACAVQNCVLKSPLAMAGPGFNDGIHFIAVGSAGKDTRQACPFGGEQDEGPPSRKEYLKYMRGMSKVGDMNSEERRAHAIAHQQEYLDKLVNTEPKKVGAPTVDVTAPGVEAVNSTTWDELRQANKFDFLITFYAPWCPHCKAFVTSDNAPLKAISESLEKIDGPKVVSFDMINSDAPLTINSVPAIYLFKRDGMATEFTGDPNNAEAMMAFTLGKPAPAAVHQALVVKKVAQQSDEHSVPSWTCPLKNCVLKSPLASAGPAFQDGVRFFATSSDGKDAREPCPFGNERDEGPPSRKEYLKYMKGMSKVGDMNSEERRAHAIAHQQEYLDKLVNSEPKEIAAPSVDVTKPGVEAVNEKQWRELRHANKFDLLVTFYAPWCPHCKGFINKKDGKQSPIDTLNEGLEKVSGPKVVQFDMTDSSPPVTLDSVPTIMLFKTNGQAIHFQGDPFDLPALTAFALDKPASAQTLLQKGVTRHLRA